jgi:hypothetical protein
MVAASVQIRIMCGVEVDAYGQPLKAWQYSPNHGINYDDYQRGAYEAYHRLSRLTQKHSAGYKAGRAAQCKLLPKRQGSRSGKSIAWGRYCGGGTWHLGENW